MQDVKQINKQINKKETTKKGDKPWKKGYRGNLPWGRAKGRNWQMYLR